MQIICIIYTENQGCSICHDFAYSPTILQRRMHAYNSGEPATRTVTGLEILIQWHMRPIYHDPKTR
jgi:hypothetical protein